MNGKRISYSVRGEIMRGRVVGDAIAMGARFYQVKDDTSGSIVSILPRQIIQKPRLCQCHGEIPEHRGRCR